MTLKRTDILTSPPWLILLLVLFAGSLKAQFFTRLQVESGTALKNGGFYFVNRPSIRIGQQIKSPNFRFNWNAVYQPEIFYSKPSVFGQRFNGQFSLLNQYKNLSTLLHFRSRYQNYKIESEYYAWQSSDLTLNVNYYATPLFFWTASVGLWYRDTNDFDQQKLNVYFGEIGPSWLIRSLIVQLQLYHERYTLIPVSIDTLKKKKGQRLGFDLHLEQNRKYILSARYRLLLHFHQNHLQPTTDQEIHFLLGFWLSSNWSILLVTEFIKLGKIKTHYEPELLYLPINSTNRIFMKLSADLSKSTEAYLRFGHEQEQLIHNNEAWQFWEIIVGLNWKKKF